MTSLAGLARGEAPPKSDDGHAMSVAYGLAQPLVAVRRLFGSRELLRAALRPAFWLAVVCAAYAGLDHHETFGSFARAFYRAFAVLAPVPSVVFAAHYARMAQTARDGFGFTPAAPRDDGLFAAAWRALRQATLVAVAVLPLVGVARLLPLLGQTLAAAVAASWAVHWVVIEALDDARLVEPGHPPAPAPPVWFARLFRGVASRAPFGLRYLIQPFALACDWMSKPWREETALLERHRAIGLGFTVATAALLATPVLNLFFRPIIIIAAVHLHGQLDAKADTCSSVV